MAYDSERGTVPSADGSRTEIQLDHWRGGDSAAFGPLYTRFAPLVRARVRRHRAWSAVAPHMQVEDVEQEVWARAVQSLERRFAPAGPGSFAAFLATVTDHTVVDLTRGVRAAKRGGGQAVDRLSTNCEDGAAALPGRTAPESPTAHARRVELQQLAQQELAPRELEAWELVELHGYTAEEAAVALHCTGAAVRGLLLRSRTRLVARLRRDGSLS